MCGCSTPCYAWRQHSGCRRRSCRCPCTISELSCKGKGRTPQLWEESAGRWLRMEDVAPTDIACVRVERGVWIGLRSRQKPCAAECPENSLLRGHPRSHAAHVGPVCRAKRCTPGGIPQASIMFVEVTTEPHIPEQDVWPVVPNKMWRLEQATAMFAVLRGHATAPPRAPAVKASSNRPGASLAILHLGSRAWCRVIVVLEPHSSMLCPYDRGGVRKLTLRLADLQALHVGTLSGDHSTALYLRGTVVGHAAPHYRRSYSGNAFHLVMVANMAPWLRAFTRLRWTITAHREKFTDVWQVQWR